MGKSVFLLLLISISIFLIGCEMTSEEKIMGKTDRELELSLKKECTSLSKEYKKQLEEEFNYIDEELHSSLHSYKMFYSPELNSCVAAYYVFTRSGKYMDYYYEIVDYLNGEKLLYSCKMTDGESYSNVDEKFNKEDFGDGCQKKRENRIESYRS